MIVGLHASGPRPAMNHAARHLRTASPRSGLCASQAQHPAHQNSCVQAAESGLADEDMSAVLKTVLAESGQK